MVLVFEVGAIFDEKVKIIDFHFLSSSSSMFHLALTYDSNADRERLEVFQKRDHLLDENSISFSSTESQVWLY